MSENTDVVKELSMARLAISDRDRLIGSYEAFVDLVLPFIPKESEGLMRLATELQSKTERLYGEDL